MPQMDYGGNKTILIHDLPGLEGWKLPERWLAVGARSRPRPASGALAAG